MPKHLSEKNSICNTYAADRTTLQKENAGHIDYSSEMNALSSITHTFVREHQQKLQHEFEYKRQTLILDAIDHRLFKNFLI
jgi:hypothetical protein